MQTLQLRKTTTIPGLRVRVCKEWDIPLGLGRSFVVSGRRIAIFKTRDGKIFAVDCTCPHRGGPLADGMIVGHQVVCPLHAFRFSADSGACDQPGTCSIETYPVELDGDSVYVSLPTA